jgi:hypothetical protein
MKEATARCEKDQTEGIRGCARTRDEAGGQRGSAGYRRLVGFNDLLWQYPWAPVEKFVGLAVIRARKKREEEEECRGFIGVGTKRPFGARREWGEWGLCGAGG